MFLVVLFSIFVFAALAVMLVFLFDVACPTFGLTCSQPATILTPTITAPAQTDLATVVSSTDSSATTAIPVPVAAAGPTIVNPLTLQMGGVV